MQWPSWLLWRSKRSDGEYEPTLPRPAPVQPARSWNDSLDAIDWKHYTEPRTLVFSTLTTLTTLALIRLYKTYFRRIPTVDHLKPTLLRVRSVYGYVTSVGDGDNFRLFHTPGGRLLGWGWAGAGRRVQAWEARDFKDKTMSVRIAGVDAPEAAHFGRPAQPHSQEALDWLRATLLHKYVRVWPYRHDQYGRVVCSVARRRWGFFRSDVGLEMLKRGLATVYEAKTGSEFGDRHEQYVAAEEKAKAAKKGLWAQPGLVARILGARKQNLETPREYKTRIKQQEQGGKTADLAK